MTVTELSIRPDEIAAALKKHVESFRPTVTREEVGRVTETGDGIARVEGMPSTMALELLEFPGGLLGMALNLDVREIGCVVFGDASGIEEGDEVKCIYVAIGQKATTVREFVSALEENGALDYTVIVSAPADLPASFKYIAPYAGSAIGQHWMYKGEHALIVFDDLSKQAEAYREISLLLRRPAGREAYPGDVFYLHSRLLERCAKLSDDLGGGSLTGLPIIETKGNDISAYIPTNVISITDGQIYLEADLFNQGVRPAINVGTSVSRVGGSAQIRAMRQVAGTLRIDLAQFRALEAFALFASDLDKASRDQLERGARMVELLKQGQYEPVPVEKQVISIWAGGNGYLDDIPVEDVRRFERELLEFMDASHPDVGEHIRNEGTLPDEVEANLKEAVEQFKSRFRPSGDRPAPREKDADPMAEGEEGQDSVKRYRRSPEDFEAEAGPTGRSPAQSP